MLFVCVLAQLGDWLMVYVHDVSVFVLAQFDDWLMVYVHDVCVCPRIA